MKDLDKTVRKEKTDEDTSTSSNDEVVDDDLFDIIRTANKGLAGSIKTSKDTTKTLKNQGKKLTKSVKKKKKIKKSIGKDEETVRSINRSGNLVVVKSSIFDKIRNFFSLKKRHEAAVDREIEGEEEKAEEYDQSEESSTDSEVIEDLEETDSSENVDNELEKTLVGLQSLRRNVHAQTRKIKAQTHAAEEMKIIDTDTSKRSKDLTKQIKKIK